MSVINVVKIREDATLPTKAHDTDSGFDVTLTHIIKKEHDVVFYGTGIQVQPPEGFFFMMPPRSSISKSGYILANSVGIIDQDYRGELIVALRKIDLTKPDLTLPCKMVQLIPTPVYHMDMKEVKEFTSTTKRGFGGFGSTGI